MEFLVWKTLLRSPPDDRDGQVLRRVVEICRSLDEARRAAEAVAAGHGSHRYDPERGCWITEAADGSRAIISVDAWNPAAEEAA